MCAGHIYGVPKGLESIACASTRTETGRCILRRRKAGTHRRAELYRTGIGAWTRFAGIFIALVSAMTVASRSCPKLSTAPTITRTAYPERFRFGRLAHVPARTTASCTRLPCVPERCAHLQTMCTHMLCTPSASAPTRWRHVPAGRCGRRVGDEVVYGSTGRRSTLRRAPPTRSPVRRSIRKVDHLPVSRPSQTGCRVLARAPPPPPSSARQRLCRARAMEQQPLVRLIAP